MLCYFGAFILILTSKQQPRARHLLWRHLKHPAQFRAQLQLEPSRRRPEHCILLLQNARPGLLLLPLALLLVQLALFDALLLLHGLDLFPLLPFDNLFHQSVSGCVLAPLPPEHLVLRLLHLLHFFHKRVQHFPTLVLAQTEHQL